MSSNIRCTRGHACGNIISPPLSILCIAARWPPLNRRIKKMELKFHLTLEFFLSLPFLFVSRSSLLSLFLSCFLSFWLQTLFLFLIFHKMSTKRSNSKKKTWPLSRYNPWLFRGVQVPNPLRHKYKLSWASSPLAFIMFSYRRERRASNWYIQNAAKRGGPAGGDTSFDVSPHSMYRRIVIKTIPTCIRKITWFIYSPAYRWYRDPWQVVITHQNFFGFIANTEPLSPYTRLVAFIEGCVSL